MRGRSNDAMGPEITVKDGYGLGTRAPEIAPDSKKHLYKESMVIRSSERSQRHCREAVSIRRARSVGR